MRILFDGVVPIAYGQVYVCSDDLPDMQGAFIGQRNGLCGAAEPGALFLMTGTHDGGVRFTVELHETEPAAASPDWTDVVEAPFVLTSAAVDLVPWGDGALTQLPLASDTLALPPFRVRYCAQAMDAGSNPFGLFDPDEIADGDYTYMDQRPDRYVLSFWPDERAGGSPPAVVIVRQTSDAAAYWHEWAAGLPDH